MPVTAPSPTPRSARAIDRLRIWHRIHVRLTLIYGLALVLVLTPAAAFVYHLAVQGELDNLALRIHGSAVSIANLVDGDRVATIDAADSPYRHELESRFGAMLTQEPELASIYLFAPTEDPTQLRFIVDADVRATPGSYGEVYDATPYPELRGTISGVAIEREPVADAWGTSISGFAPIRDRGGKTVAIAGVDIDAARVDQMKARLLRTALATTLGAFALLTLAAIGVARILRRPMERIIAGTEQIADGHLEARVGLEREDEFGVLGRHFDAMAGGLEDRERIRAMFGRYVSEDVARKLLADRGGQIVAGEERQVTVLFTDLRGYSTIAEALGPTEIMRLLNAYFEAMSDAIEAHEGCIIEYLGDGILTVFGAPDALPDHPVRAVRCALAMRERLVALNAELDRAGTSALWRARGVERLTAKTGIHSGAVVAGSLGSRVRMKYAVLGDAVNVAARLEGLARDLKAEVVLSREIYDTLPADLAAQFAERGTHVVKGRAQPVTVYAL